MTAIRKHHDRPPGSRAKAAPKRGAVPPAAAAGTTTLRLRSGQAETWLAAAWPYAVVAAIAVAFCGRAIFTGRALAPLDMLLLMSPWKSDAHLFTSFTHVQTPMLDPVQQYFPWRLFAVSSLKHGVIPLWNPYAFAGTPFVANLQSAVFYPPNLLFLVMPVALGFTYTAALHLILAGCCMLFFLRVWGLGRWPALAGATAYMLNGYFIAWLEYPAIGLWVAVWLPLLLALYELALRRRSVALTALAGFIVGVQFLGGHLQVAAYVIFAFLLYAGFRTVWPAGDGNDGASSAPNAAGDTPPATVVSSIPRYEPLLRAVAALSLGLLLAAGQLLPTMELAPRSHRPPASPATIQGTALPFTHLVIYFVPKFFGTAADFNYWGNLVGRPAINFFETSGYVGILPLLLACFGALEWRRPVTKYLLALVTISLLLALGTPLYLLFFYAAPGFKQLAGVARVMYLVAFGLSALAALGLDRLLRQPFDSAQGRPRARVAGIFSVIALVFVGADLSVFRPQIIELGRAGVEPAASFPHYLAMQVALFLALLAASWIVILARARMRPAAFGLLCLALIVVDLFGAWVRFNPVTDPRMAFFKTAPTTLLRDRADGARILSVGTSFLDWMPPNTPMAYSLRDIQGSDSLWWERYYHFLNAIQPGAPTFAWRNLDSPALDLLAVRYILATRAIESRRWDLVSEQGALVYRSRAAAARVRLVADWRVVSDAEALRAVAAGDAHLLAAPMLSAAPAIGLEPGGVAGAAEIVADRINSVSVLCRAPAPRLLVLADPNYPGWRARIDGRPAPHLSADYVLRAAAVPSGRHLVLWQYEPTSFRLGLFGGLLGAAVLVAGLVMGIAARKRAVP